MFEIILMSLPRLFVTAFVAVLFLQSGLDKVLNYRANIAYHRDHFKNSPLAGWVGFMTAVITVLEVAAGTLSAAGLISLLVTGSPIIAFYGLVFAAKALLCLFFGQRLAKDYAGAAALVPYFLTVLAGLWLLGPR